MRTLLRIIMHLLTTLAKRVGPGSTEALIAETHLESTADCPIEKCNNVGPSPLF